ncbi:hypothetical protein RclHR1_00750016 [Rhizophagus clarus]|uniref:Lipopolysaccharide-induced tumor necrosis factor-alpha factor n=1 Tax=Rhizophagus clarus TaxID=94130 RepID=A0A2Z6SD63_9GLOM|nr:hypothetical protein RclHR1_00750016 [Rhizophagus clarus]GES85854.1 lipopolysaccharide-induced tumor necrosis factor-alpha factor [Rhizophagus clarus]
MSNNYNNTTKDNLHDNDSINQEPPPPYTSTFEQAESGAASSRAILYGGATEQTYLLSNNNFTSYNLSQQPLIKKNQRNVYLPTPNLSYAPPNISDGGYYQQPGLIAFRTTTVPLKNLSTVPAITTCPHCNNVVLSYIEYKSGSCTWLSCFIISHMLVAACFIPFCVNDLKDVVHYCSNCNKIMAIYSRLNDKTYNYSYT